MGQVVESGFIFGLSDSFTPYRGKFPEWLQITEIPPKIVPIRAPNERVCTRVVMSRPQCLKKILQFLFNLTGVFEGAADAFKQDFPVSNTEPMHRDLD